MLNESILCWQRAPRRRRSLAHRSATLPVRVGGGRAGATASRHACPDQGAPLAFDLRMAEWRKETAHRRELVNHSLFRQCWASLPERSRVRQHRALDTTSVAKMVDQVSVANTLLQAIDGQRERTLTTPRGDRVAAGGKDYVAVLKRKFVAIKVGAVSGALVSMRGVDPYRLSSRWSTRVASSQLKW